MMSFLFQAPEISEFFNISGPIWLKFGSEGKFKALILSVKWYFTSETNIKSILAIFGNFYFLKLLNQATNEQKHFWIIYTLYTDPNSLQV